MENISGSLVPGGITGIGGMDLFGVIIVTSIVSWSTAIFITGYGAGWLRSRLEKIVCMVFFLTYPAKNMTG